MPFEILLPLWKSLHCIVLYDSESLSFLGPKIWEMLPLDLKNSHSLDSLKSGIKNWRPPSSLYTNNKMILAFNLLRLDPTECSNTLSQFVNNNQRIVGVYLVVLWVQVVKG